MLGARALALLLTYLGVCLLLIGTAAAERTHDPRCAGYRCPLRDPQLSFATDPSICNNGTYCPPCLDSPAWRQIIDDLGVHEARTLPINLIFNPWLTAELVDTIAKILLNEVLGYRANAVNFHIDGDMDILCCDQMLVELEQWPSGRRVDDQGTFTLAKSPVGYEGYSSLFVPEYVAQRHPMSTAANAYLYLQEYAHILPPAFSTNCTFLLKNKSLGCVRGNYWCDDNTWGGNGTCVDGRFAPPQCIANRSACQEIYLAHPTFDKARFEAQVLNWGLNFTIAYLGIEGMPGFVREAAAARRDVMFYWWEPDAFSASMRARPVNFRPNTLECEAAHEAASGDPLRSSFDCDYPRAPLLKQVRREWLERDRHFANFFQNFQLSSGALKRLLLNHTTAGGRQNAYNLSCEWVRAHQTTWQSWVQLPRVRTIAVPTESGTFPVWGIVLIVVLVAAPLAVAAVFFGRRRMLLARWPLDESKPYTVMLVGTGNSESVLEVFPDHFASAQAAVNAALRSAVDKTACVEARRIDACTTLVVAKEPERALECAQAFLVAVDRLDWGVLLPESARTDMFGSWNIPSANQSEGSRTTGAYARPGHTKAASPHSISRNNAHRNGRLPDGDNASQRSSQHRVANAERLNPVIGINHDRGGIDHDPASGVTSYHGDVVAFTARLTDMAVDRQVLVSADVAAYAEERAPHLFDAMDEFVHIVSAKRGRGSGTFTTSSRMDRSTESAESHSADAVMTYTFHPHGVSDVSSLKARVAEAKRQRRRASADAVPDDELAASRVTAALLASETGMSTRRIAAAVVHVPQLRGDARRMSRDEHQRRVASVVEIAERLARAYRCKIESIADGYVVVTVNALSSQPVAVPISKAVGFALALTEHAAHSIGGVRGRAGVASSSSLVGNVSEQHVIIGDAINHARLLQLAAHYYGLPAVVPGDYMGDVFSLYECLTIDFALIPADSVATSASGSTTTATATNGRVQRLVGVARAREQEMEGEWLYLIADQCGATETMFDQVEQGTAVQRTADDDASDVKSASSATAAAAADDVMQRMRRVARHSASLAGRAPSLRQYAAERTRVFLSGGGGGAAANTAVPTSTAPTSHPTTDGAPRHLSTSALPPSMEENSPSDSFQLPIEMRDEANAPVQLEPPSPQQDTTLDDRAK